MEVTFALTALRKVRNPVPCNSYARYYKLSQAAGARRLCYMARVDVHVYAFKGHRAIFLSFRCICLLAFFIFLMYSSFEYIRRRGGLMVSALVSGSTGSGSSPGRGLCYVIEQDTVLSQCLFPPRCINGSWRTSRKGWGEGSRNTPGGFTIQKQG